MTLPAVLTLGDTDWPVAVNRRPGCRRITLRLCAATDTLRVGAPLRCPEAAIRDVLLEFSPRLAARAAALPPRIPFVPGARLPFRDGSLTLVRDPDAVPGLSGSAPDFVLTVGGGAEHFARRIRDRLVRIARADLSAAVDAAVLRMEDIPHRPIRRIGTGDPRARWGSCAVDGTLRFSWRLILAPSPVLYGVAAHEAAHLAEASHNGRFHRILSLLDPSAAAHDAWLAGNGTRLHRLGPVR